MDELLAAVNGVKDQLVDGSVEFDALNAIVEKAVRRFFMALLKQTVERHQFSSPILSYCAMLGRISIRRSTNTPASEYDEEADGARRNTSYGIWNTAGNYNSNLSALIWVQQVIIFEYSCYKAGSDETFLTDVLKATCKQYMNREGHNAFMYILNWRPYLTTVSKYEVQKDQAQWLSEDDAVLFKGTKLAMSQISQLIAMTYRRAHLLLYEQLLFGSYVPSIQACFLQDDINCKEPNMSWLQYKPNDHLLRGADSALVKTIQRKPELRRGFTSEEGLSSHAMDLYEAQVQQFLTAMLVLIHISPAPPMRSPELLSTTTENSAENRRNLYIWHKKVMLYIQYHKSQELIGRRNENVRFLPDRVGDLLVMFLAYVQPLRQRFQRASNLGSALSPNLWSRLDGKPWPDTVLSESLSHACASAMVPEFKTAWWRQVATVITKVKFLGKHAHALDDDDSDGAEDLLDHDQLFQMMSRTSNHSARTASTAYAGTNTLGLDTFLSSGMEVSSRWQDLFNVDTLLSREIAARRNKRSLSLPPDEMDEVMRLSKRVMVHKKPVVNSQTLLHAAQDLHDDPDFKFRSRGQRMAMLATLGLNAHEQVVVVLGTGSGKSLVFMVGAALEGARVTIVVVPLVALRNNMLDRLAKLGLKTAVWTPELADTSVQVVLVSAEAACTKPFLHYAHLLSSHRSLDRIVVDECHLTITASFRDCMMDLASNIMQIPTQTVWLTATLPPTLESTFISHNLLTNPHIIRESTNRPNIQYEVMQAPAKQRLFQAVCIFVTKYVNKMTEEGTKEEKRVKRIIVYCPTLAMVDEIAEVLHSLTFTGEDKNRTPLEKKAIIQEWLGPTGSPVIVATSALGVGFDYADVSLVVHAGAPRRMTDFAQESGRAGRTGKTARSVVFLPATWRLPANDANNDRDEDQEAMLLYLMRKHCLRGIMSQYLDAAHDWTWCMHNRDTLCGVCPELHSQPRSMGLEMLPPPAMPEEVFDDEFEEPLARPVNIIKATARNPDKGVNRVPVESLPKSQRPYSGLAAVLDRNRAIKSDLNRFKGVIW
ncbi:uncharacterized protein BROUX77_004191 [Berkeleyomyces rouxiae]|uniref:uncharacterized protein n=1 Tax=Berkeleyomyces rouxiae TaxID=2035830 RepID=UPI003B780CF1